MRVPNLRHGWIPHIQRTCIEIDLLRKKAYCIIFVIFIIVPGDQVDSQIEIFGIEKYLYTFCAENHCAG